MSMDFPSILTIVIIGASGLIAQVLLMRELLVSFYGNELTVGIMLADWMVLEALGVFIFGKLFDKTKKKIPFLIVLEIVFIAGLLFSVFGARVFKPLLRLSPGQGISLAGITIVSFVLFAPVAVSHGGLFSACCSGLLHGNQDQRSGISSVYTWETVGTMLGGIVFTFLWIPLVSSFGIVFNVLLLNILVCLVLVRRLPAGSFRIIISVASLATTVAVILVNPARLEHSSLQIQYSPSRVIEYRNSHYGNIVLSKLQSQETLMYNGFPVMTMPYPDAQVTEEMGEFPLLFHPAPHSVLVIGNGVGGLLAQIDKNPIQRVDYIEQDAEILKVLRNRPSPLISGELADARLTVLNQDARFFLQTSHTGYDVILLGFQQPTDLVSNRFFTKEFFCLAKSRLTKGGILALRLPGSLTYLGRPLRDLNGSVINALRAAYLCVRIIPGDYNIMLASDSLDLASVSPQTLIDRMRQRSIKATLLIPSYIQYRLETHWVDWFQLQMEGIDIVPPNSDVRPFALFQALLLWNRQFSPLTARLFTWLSQLRALPICLVLILVTLVAAGRFLKKKSTYRNVSCLITLFTTGFFGMAINLLLLSGFQVTFGYLYTNIGFLIALFMSGIACSSAMISRLQVSSKALIKAFLLTEAAIIAFTLFVALYLLPRITYSASGFFIFIVLFFLSGVFLGIEFPLAAAVYKTSGSGVGSTAGALYAADLAGGCCAGLGGGIVLLPILGLAGSGACIAVLKSCSFLLLLLVSVNLLPAKG